MILSRLSLSIITAIIAAVIVAGYRAVPAGAQGPFEYVSPRPGAALVSAGTTIAVRHGDPIVKNSLADLVFTVTGSQSGLRAGRVILADDQKTVIFKPETFFKPAETVTVTIQAGLKTVAGDTLEGLSYTFTVSPIPLLETRAGRPVGDVLTSLGPEKTAKNGGTGIFSHTIANYATLPDNFPVITITVPANDTGPGLLFLSNFSLRPPNPYLLIMDNYGEPVFYKKMTPGERYSDFRKQPNGLLTYYDPPSASYRALDDAYHFVDTYQAGNGYIIDGHGIHVAENGHILLQIYDEQPVDMSQIVSGGVPTATVIGAVVQELDPSRNVIFEWRSWDHFDITDASDDIDLTTERVDVTHINSVAWDTDGHILISNRHLDEITKINRRTADVIWRMGGKRNAFTFVNEDRPFSHQHDARRLPNGNLTLYDNGNTVEPQYSRAVEYQLDEVNKVATKVWEYRNQPEDIYGFATGSAQRLAGGNTVIAWGGVGLGESRPVVTEVKPDSSKAFEMFFVNNESSYRVFRQSWTGQPVEPPTLVVRTGQPTPTLHYSWNGATEIDAYRIYGGETPSPGDLKDLMGTQPKRSFETTSVLSGSHQAPCYFYRVMPLDRNGQETIYSNPVFVGDETCDLVATLSPSVGVSKSFTGTNIQGQSPLSVTVQAPTGAVSHTLVLIYTDYLAPNPAGQSPPPGLVFANTAFSLNVHREGNPQTPFAFNKPITVVVTYQAGALAGLDETGLAVYYWDPDQQIWAADGLNIIEHNSLRQQMTFTTTHLTQFALFAPRQPLESLNLIKDGSFEGGPANSAWLQGSTNLPAVICDGRCSYDSIPQTHTGDYWVFFGGGLAQKEEAYVRQAITAPAGQVVTATLTFWFRIAEASHTGADTFSLSIDQREIFTATDADMAGYQHYTPVSIDVTPYVSQTHTLSFEAVIQAAQATSFYLDDVSLVVEGHFGPDNKGGVIYLPLLRHERQTTPTTLKKKSG